MPRDGTAAATALAQTGLVLPDPDRLRMLAPVREHAAEHTPGEPEATALAAHFAALADTLPYLGASSYDRDAALRARVELPNIEAVLPRRTADAEGSALGWRWIRVGDTRQTLGSIGSGHDRLRDTPETASPLRPPPTPAAPSPAARPLRQLGQARRRAAWPKATCQAPSRPSPTARTSPTSSPPPTPATPSGSATSPSAGTSSATCAAQGDLPGALQAFTESKNIADKLAAADPGNAEWQRDLSVSWNKLGDVRWPRATCQAPSRPSPTARTSRDQLAAADPGNAEWQRDLSVSWNKLGDVRLAQGDLARRPPGLHRQARTSRDKLAAADPGNAQWQRDLSVSWNGSARSDAPQDDPGALAAKREALANASEALGDAATWHSPTRRHAPTPHASRADPGAAPRRRPGRLPIGDPGHAERRLRPDSPPPP